MVLERLSKDQLTFRAVTLDKWPDLEMLFEEQPEPQQGCWRMYWRIKRSECQKQFGEGNKQALKELIESGRVPGILAYLNERPIGWCSVAPREQFLVLDHLPMLKRIDDEHFWSIVCFFLSRPFRRRALSRVLITAAVEHARQNGARINESFPLVHENTKYPKCERYMRVFKKCRGVTPGQYRKSLIKDKAY